MINHYIIEDNVRKPFYPQTLIEHTVIKQRLSLYCTTDRYEHIRAFLYIICAHSFRTFLATL